MKVFKKMLSVFLTAVIMVSAMCVGTVSAGAEDKPNYKVTVGYENYIKEKGSGNYVIEVSNISKEEFSFIKEWFDKENGNIQISLGFDTIFFLDFSWYDLLQDDSYYYFNNYPLFSFSIGDNTYDNAKITSELIHDPNKGVTLKYILDPNDSACMKAIKKLEKSTKCSVSVGIYDMEYRSYYSKPYSVKVDNKSTIESNKANEDKEKLAALGDPPVANGNSSDRKYTVEGYYNKDKSKYCVKVGGITKTEYQYLQDCLEYYSLYDSFYNSGWQSDGIVIKLQNSKKEYKDYGYAFLAVSQADYDGEYSYSLSGNWKNKSDEELSGKFIENGDTYDYIFYIDIGNSKGKKTAEALTDLKKTEAMVTIEYLRLFGADTKSGYSEEHLCYYYKDTIPHEYSTTANYTKSTKATTSSTLGSSSSSKTKISTLSISKPANKTYTGKNRKAAVTIKDGDYALKKGTDYTLTYKNCKNIGTASVTIKGKGDYTGSKTLTYKIVPKKTTLKAEKKSDTKVKLSWTAVDGAEKYQIYYSTNGGKYKKLTTVSGSKTSVTISKLDFEKNDYKFKIRSYAVDDDTKYYSSYSKAVTVK